MRHEAVMQMCITATMEWARDWCMRINLKPGKTQGVRVRGAPRTGPDPPPPAPPDGGRGADGNPLHVTWAAGYRYLGLPIKGNLDWEPSANKRIAQLNFGYARYFRYNNVIHRLPLCAQIQLLQTLVISGVNYLIGALPITTVQSRKMDAAARRSVRRMFGIPSKAPNELVDAEVSFLPFASTILMHQVRLYLSVKHNPFQQMPAARILAFEEGAKVPAGSFASRTLSALAELGKPEGRGADAQPTFVMPEVKSSADIHNTVVCLRRADAFRSNRINLPFAV